MDPLTYKIIHLVGLMGLFSALGGLVAADVSKPARLRIFTITHGISLLLLLVSGFGMQAKYYYHIGSVWIIGKLIIWALLGASLVILKRRLIPAGGAWIIVIILGSAAAILAIKKPGHKSKTIEPEQSLILKRS